MKGLFGDEVINRQVTISVYCDERKVDGCQHPLGENWVYVSLLIVPDDKKAEVLEVLNRHRTTEEYDYEIKFRKIRRPSGKSKITKVARLWLNEITNDPRNRFYFKVLGIRKDNLLSKLFGAPDSIGIDDNIYNRFFRAAFLGALNSYFPREQYDKVIITHLFHDRHGGLERHQYFPRHLFSKLGEKRVVFSNTEVKFVDSNHKREVGYQNESHFIQLADILVGSLSHCLDLPSDSNDGRNEIGRVQLPFLRNLMHLSSGKYQYFRKYDISFFPLRKLKQLVDLTEMQSQFFKERRILLQEHLYGRQLTLLAAQ
jgi:hypothetical protein